MMNDKSPLYTGIFWSRDSITFYVNRSEWRELNRFQATNQTMLAVLLPHNDDTIIEFFDDKSGERLLNCTPKDPRGNKCSKVILTAAAVVLQNLAHHGWAYRSMD